MKRGLRLVVCVMLAAGCSPDPYPHVPATASACEGACIVLATFPECRAEAMPEEPGKCEARCEQIARLGYVWNTNTSGPTCIREARTLEAVRACNVKCEGGQ
jgi:hypothetical protein